MTKGNSLCVFEKAAGEQSHSYLPGPEQGPSLLGNPARQLWPSGCAPRNLCTSPPVTDQPQLAFRGRTSLNARLFRNTSAPALRQGCSYPPSKSGGGGGLFQVIPITRKWALDLFGTNLIQTKIQEQESTVPAPHPPFQHVNENWSTYASLRSFKRGLNEEGAPQEPSCSFCPQEKLGFGTESAFWGWGEWGFSVQARIKIFPSLLLNKKYTRMCKMQRLALRKNKTKFRKTKALWHLKDYFKVSFCGQVHFFRHALRNVLMSCFAYCQTWQFRHGNSTGDYQ